MSSYPKWLYHHDHGSALVPDEAAHKALGAGWVESPAAVKKPEAAPKPHAPEKADSKKEK